MPGSGPLNSFWVRIYRIGNIDLVVPVIDGVALYEMLDAGRPGIPLEWIRTPSRQWLGAPEVSVYGRAVVLDGECGIAECCGVVARISVLSDTVIWDQILANGGPDVPDQLRGPAA